MGGRCAGSVGERRYDMWAASAGSGDEGTQVRGTENCYAFITLVTVDPFCPATGNGCEQSSQHQQSVTDARGILFSSFGTTISTSRVQACSALPNLSTQQASPLLLADGERTCHRRLCACRAPGFATRHPAAATPGSTCLKGSHHSLLIILGDLFGCIPFASTVCSPPLLFLCCRSMALSLLWLSPVFTQFKWYGNFGLFHIIFFTC